MGRRRGNAPLKTAAAQNQVVSGQRLAVLESATFHREMVMQREGFLSHGPSVIGAEGYTEWHRPFSGGLMGPKLDNPRSHGAGNLSHFPMTLCICSFTLAALY